MGPSLADRAAYYNTSRWGTLYPASRLWPVEEKGLPVLYGVWLSGQDFRGTSPFYGAYPRTYLDRVLSLFPDLTQELYLHVFSGSLPPSPLYLRVDSHPDRECDISGTVEDLQSLFEPDQWSLVLADPPYSEGDAQKYSTPMVNRRLATASLATVTRPGGYLVWLDTVGPQFRKEEWRTVARIYLERSTNQRIRKCTIFERL